MYPMYRELIQRLDNKQNPERLDIIIKQLESWNISFVKQQYSSGTNLIVDLGNPGKKLGISSHFDRVSSSPGANDNGSAIAVCLDLIKKFKNADNGNLGLRVFFFDEEETGLKGSTAYVKQRGVKDMVGLINLEMVGVGDKFALWPVNDNSNGKILESFEMASRRSKIVTKRFDQIVTNTADHVSFQKAGLEAFTITCISDGDIETAYHYDKALSFDVDMETLREILSTAPIFEHYHRSTDTYDRINEESILMTSSIIWSTILTVQK